MEGIVELLEVLMPFIQDLARTFEEAAPAVWGMVRLKVISDGLSHIVWSLVFGIVSIAFHRIANKQCVNVDKDGDPVHYDAWITCRVVGWIALVVAAIFVSCAIPRFVATDYYVLLELVELVRGGQ